MANSNFSSSEVIDLMKACKTEDAFRQIVPHVHNDIQAQALFCQLLRSSQNIFLIMESFKDFVEKYALEGNPWMQYAWARYHDCVNPDSDSIQIAEEYYNKAIEAGISDARMFLAYCWRDGDFGMVDRSRYIRERERAVREDSHAAVQQQLRDICYGNEGYEADPDKAFRMLSKFIQESNDQNYYIDPRYYTLYGDILEALGEKEKSVVFYNHALNQGDKGAFFNLMVSSYMDENYKLKNSDESQEFMQRGQNLLCGDAFMSIQWAVDPEYWDDYGEELQATITDSLKNDLEIAHRLGAKLAEYSMGCHYYYGDCGFEQDNEQAFSWFAKGALRRCASCYAMIVTMFDEGTNPDRYGEDFKYEAMIRSLRLGNEDMLPRVVEAYQNDHFTEYAAEIEQYYLPKYQDSGITDDELPDDDGRFDAWA